MNQSEDAALEHIVKKLNIGGYQRHIFLCTGPKCCSSEDGMRLWGYLKARTKELGLTNGSVFRSKVGCLRICCQGPIAVVYPDGTWYRNLSETALERIIHEHLIGGKPVPEYLFARNPLGD